VKHFSDLEKILQFNSDRYLGSDHCVSINNKDYSFFKCNLDIYPKKIKHFLYDVKKRQFGTYILREILTGYVYVGSSEEIYKRISKHKYLIARRKHDNSKFTELLKTTNIQNFEMIVFFTNNRDEAYQLEQYLIDRYKKSQRLLNIANDVRYAMLGHKQTEEHKQKIRKALLGRVHNDNSKRLMSEHRKNNPLAQAQQRAASELVKKKIILNGTLYQSITEAAKQTRLGESTLRREITKKKKKSLDGAYVLNYSKPARKRIIVNGVEYVNVSIAAKELGIKDGDVRNAIRTGRAFYV